MSKINQKLDEVRDEKSVEQEEILAEEAAREDFQKEEQKEEQERNAFRLGKSRRNIYEELSREGIEDGRYKVRLMKVATATTRGGKPIVRFTYRLAEPYIYKEDELTNVTVNTTSSDEWSTVYNTNFALQTLGTLYDILSADEGFDEAVTQQVIADLQEQLEAGLSDKEFEADIKVTKLKAERGNEMVFYTVYPQ